MRETAFTGSDGAKLAADVAGEGPPVILLHGAGQTRHAWRRTVENLARRGHEAIALDLRGHGQSDWSKTGYDFDVFVADLRAVIATLSAPPALIGASFGGMISLLAVGEGGAGVAAALVLVDIALRINPVGRDAVRAFMSAHDEGFANLDEAADAVSKYLPNRPRPKDVSGLRKNLREGADRRLYWHWDPKMFDNARTEVDLRQRLDAAAAHIAVPTLLVRGARSEVVDADGVDHFLEQVPTAEFAEVQGAAHMVAGDANTPFASAVLDFLARVYPA